MVAERRSRPKITNPNLSISYPCLVVGALSADPSKFTKDYCGLFTDSGVPPSDHRQFREWSGALIAAAGNPDPSLQAAGAEASQNGFGERMPARLLERSGIVAS